MDDLILLSLLFLAVLLIAVLLLIGYHAHHRWVERRRMEALNHRLNYIQQIGDQ